MGITKDNQLEVQELYFITHIHNVGSILKHGILCHNLAKKVKHETIAEEGVQKRRANRPIPGAGGARLHDYANLYFNARNPMMYIDRIRNNHMNLCVLGVHPNVMGKQGVAIADGNAANDLTRFWSYPDGLSRLNFDRIFTKNWNDDNIIIRKENKRLMMAEVLVPERVDPSYILRAHISCNEGLRKLMNQDFNLHAFIDANMFFQ